MLVFGKNGQVGFEVVRQARADHVVAVGREEVDLSDPQQIRDCIRAISPTVIVNAAAYTNVDKAESEPKLAEEINATAPAVMADEAQRLGALMVHYSTDYVFAGDKGKPYLEEDPTAPLNVYGASKLRGEEAIRASQCEHLIFRTSWVFADRGSNFVRTILRLAAERENLNVVSDQTGSPTSSAEIARATLEAVHQITERYSGERKEHTGTYHVTCSGTTSWFEFAQQIVERAQKIGFSFKVGAIEPITTTEYPTPAARPQYSVLSNAKLYNTFGIELRTWESALDEILAALRMGVTE
jgi:dTDP-4-dehydrorhamnose reductase